MFGDLASATAGGGVCAGAVFSLGVCPPTAACSTGWRRRPCSFGCSWCLKGDEPGEGSQVQWDGPGKRELPWGGQCSGFGAEHSWGLCVSPQDKPSALSMYCRASTVEEGVKTHFLFFIFFFFLSSGQTKALSCCISSDRTQQQSWLSHPVLSWMRPDLELSFWKDKYCAAFTCHLLWSTSHGTKLLGGCWVQNCASQASVIPFLCCSWSLASRPPPHSSWLGATHDSGRSGGGAGLGVRKVVVAANVEAE